MAFRKPKAQPEFASLKNILAQVQTDNPFHQTVQELIERLIQFQGLVVEDLRRKISEDDADGEFASRSATFITESDHSTTLPNSRMLVAGEGIELDYTVANELTINALASGYAPMSTGAEPLEIMSDGAGSVLMVGFSE